MMSIAETRIRPSPSHREPFKNKNIYLALGIFIASWGIFPCGTRTLMDSLVMHRLSSCVPGLVAPWSWDLRSPGRDQTCTPCGARWLLNHWTTREETICGTFWWFSCHVFSQQGQSSFLSFIETWPSWLNSPIWGRLKVKVAQACLTVCDPMDCIVHGILQARILEWVAFPFSRDLPNPGIKPRSPTLQVDSLPAEPQRKPKNTRVGSLSLLQWIFLTQESNWGLLHCRQILYQLSYQGSPWRGCLRTSVLTVIHLLLLSMTRLCTFPSMELLFRAAGAKHFNS